MSGMVINPTTGKREFLGRYIKPGYRYESPQTVTVPASSSKPAYFVIDGTPYTVISDLDCRCSSLVANTPYYLYAVESSGSVILTYDAADPEIGPSGYGKWTYIGAFATYSSSATIPEFKAANGVLIADDEIETNTQTGSTAASLETYSSMPVTVKNAWIRLELDGPNLSTGRVTGADDATGNNAIVLNMQVANRAIYGNGWVPVLTAKKLYLTTANSGNTVSGHLQGWQEDPSEYK